MYFCVDEYDQANNLATREHNPGPASVARLRKLIERHNLKSKRITLDNHGPSLYYDLEGPLKGVQK